ncbi:EAL domain-containing protein [Falsirhodobacter halotolerans]|uniref:EAL domain-containing protein n=1 Tax=Falsirhodobacter halotolerans TaxID=1146892 RepID=UPI001FD60253|nr:EAL domain-containing protein [Falsirhodobacter halotolerans]MCJ8139787.1 EAL domain-containing protein [Falsirhodobacter halotolerans]
MTNLFHHDPMIFGAAISLCSFATLVGTSFLRRAWADGAPRRWGVLSAAVLGAGWWVSQLLFLLSHVMDAAPRLQTGALVISLLMLIALAGAMVWVGRRRGAAGGVIYGLGTAASGMTGLTALGAWSQVVWDTDAMLVAFVIPAMIGAGAIAVLRSATRWVRAVGVGGMVVTALVAHVLTYRTLTPFAGRVVDADTSLLPLGVMLTIGFSTCVLLAVPLVFWLMDVRRERQMELQAHRLRELANVSQEGLISAIDGMVTSCNLSFVLMTGFDAGIALSDVVDVGGLDRLRANPTRVQEIDIRSKDGTVIPVEATLRLVTLGNRSAEAIALRDLRGARAAEAESERIVRARLDAERRFRFLIQSVTNYAIYMLTPEGFIANWNAGAQRNKGYTSDEVVGKHFSIFFSPEDQKDRLPYRMLDRALLDGKFEAEGWRFRKDGTRFWAHVLLEPITDDDGQHIGFVKVTHDNTRQKEDAEQIASMSRNLTAALENMIQGIALFDPDGALVLTNTRLAQILGRPAPTGQTLIEFATDVSAQLTASSTVMDELYRMDGQGRRQRTLELHDGRTLLVTHRTIPEGGWVSTFEDVSERTRSERQIVHMARHDALTGLPNRASFAEHLAWALDDAGVDGGMQVAVLGIDLDRFKEINDHLGHAVGDDVLIGLATRLTNVLEKGEFLARFGGDEFAAYKAFRTREEVEAFAARLLETICQPIPLAQNELSVGASIGIALFPEDGHVGGKLISNADMAMYRAKSSITEKICYYEAEMDEASRTRRQMARDLWRAVERDELYLHHQIQKSVTTGETTGYEVLLRWQHPERGNISPADFIPVAEECGAILHIGEWVLRTACEQAARLPNKVRIAVNLSPVQLGNPRFVTNLQAVLDDTGLEPWRLELEVTESAIIADKEWALHMLAQIKDLGVTIAIDDFGTGYSSLETLRSFAFDKIKLDRSFIREVETSRQAKAIVRAILALGRSLEVPILAEGVETLEQLHLLRSEGCDEAQGFLLGRPGRLESVMPDLEVTEQVA